MFFFGNKTLNQRWGANSKNNFLLNSPFPSFRVTGRALSDLTGSFSLVPKNELHASWRHVGVILQGG